MTQLNLTLTQEEILELLKPPKNDAFKVLSQNALSAFIIAESDTKLQAKPHEQTGNLRDYRIGDVFLEVNAPSPGAARRGGIDFTTRNILFSGEASCNFPCSQRGWVRPKPEKPSSFERLHLKIFTPEYGLGHYFTYDLYCKNSQVNKLFGILFF